MKVEAINYTIKHRFSDKYPKPQSPRKINIQNASTEKLETLLDASHRLTCVHPCFFESLLIFRRCCPFEEFKWRPPRNSGLTRTTLALVALKGKKIS